MAREKKRKLKIEKEKEKEKTRGMKITQHRPILKNKI